MNNKIVGVIILVLVVLAALLLLTNKQQKTQPTTAVQTNQSSPQSNKPKEQTATITLTSSGFSPDTLTVKAGTRVTWINKSGAVATVNSDKHPTHLLYPPLNLGRFNDGSSVQLVFDKPGTYGYHDHLNPSLTGTVVVE